MSIANPSDTYVAVHFWIRDHHVRTGQCEHCGSTERVTEWASIGHSYTRNRADWIELCRKCHRAMDAKTHCKRGHPFDEENTCHRKDGSRLCRTCAREYARQRRKEKSRDQGN